MASKGLSDINKYHSPPDQSHLVNNRERNQLLRQDTPKAKQEQIREDHEAAMAQTAFELSLAQQ